jgi:hypothetical protein
MKKLIALLLSFGFAGAVHATPPGDVNVSYDLVKQTITVMGPHPTNDMTEHYIRRVEVSVNGAAPKMFYFPKQSSASEFNETVNVPLKPNDHVHVKVACSEGGSKEADLHIPEAKPEEQAPVDLKTIKDKDHENIQVIP